MTLKGFAAIQPMLTEKVIINLAYSPARTGKALLDSDNYDYEKLSTFWVVVTLMVVTVQV